MKFFRVLQMLHKLCLPEFDISRLFVEHTSILQLFFFLKINFTFHFSVVSFRLYL